MNKKNVILAISLMASATALVLPMSTNEKRIIRKELYSNYENNRINTATLAENGLTVLDIIDRDIQILSEHKNMLQSKVDSGKGFFVRRQVGWGEGVWWLAGGDDVGSDRTAVFG